LLPVVKQYRPREDEGDEGDEGDGEDGEVEGDWGV